MQSDKELIILAATMIQGVGAIALAHFLIDTKVSQKLRWLMWATIVPFLGIWINSIFRIATSPKISLLLLAATALSFGAVLFMVLSELMIRGLAKKLTEWRGEKWVKELDYFYLALGAIGVVLSMNRLESVDHKAPIPEFLGPFILAIALVLRAIKTRAEINGWNKLLGTINRQGSNAFAYAVAWTALAAANIIWLLLDGRLLSLFYSGLQ